MGSDPIFGEEDKGQKEPKKAVKARILSAKKGKNGIGS